MLVESPTIPVSEISVRKKIAWRILPFVFVLYIVSYLDRANVAFAKMSMSEDLHFSEAVFGCLTGASAYAWAPAFWALPTLLLGQSAAAVSVGFINCFGSLGGFVGPVGVGYLLSQGYPKVVVLGFLQLSFLLAALFLCLTRPTQTENKAV
jgi:sugar phosphate permease